MDWNGLSDILLKQESRGVRIVRVWHPDAPPRWIGENIDAPCEIGAPAYQINTGEIVEVD